MTYNIITITIMAPDEHAKVEVVRSHRERYNQDIPLSDVIFYLLALAKLWN